MKNRIIKMCLLLAVLAFSVSEADAQAKKPNRTTKKRTTTTKKAVLPIRLIMQPMQPLPLHLWTR
jgi:hypothetical protein